MIEALGGFKIFQAFLIKLKTHKNMLQIGVTGGIGSGKSIICRIFASLGVPIYDADVRAKAIMNENEKLKNEIIQHFGEESYTNGHLDRSYLAAKVFSDADAVKKLNSLVHPKVAEDYIYWAQKQYSLGVPYVVREAALMIESNSHKQLDKLITVFAPEDLRIQRVQKRDPQRTDAEIKAIISKQISEEEKIKLANYVIYNDDKTPVLPQILELDANFRR